jgi:hypothetical protein
MLEQIGLVWNKRFGFLSCLMHGQAFEGIPTSHLQNKHNIKLSHQQIRDLQQLIYSIGPEQQNNFQQLLDGRQQEERVDGLEVMNGWKCGVCKTGTLYSIKKRTINDHCKSLDHPEGAIQQCSLQTVFKRRCFKKSFR